MSAGAKQMNKLSSPKIWPSLAVRGPSDNDCV